MVLAKQENICYGTEHGMLNLRLLKQNVVIIAQYFVQATPLKSQSDDNMIKASVVEGCGVDSTGEEGSVGVKGQLQSLLMLQQLLNSDFQPC